MDRQQTNQPTPVTQLPAVHPPLKLLWPPPCKPHPSWSLPLQQSLSVGQVLWLQISSVIPVVSQEPWHSVSEGQGRGGTGLNSTLELEVKNRDGENGSVQNHTVIKSLFGG